MVFKEIKEFQLWELHGIIIVSKRKSLIISAQELLTTVITSGNHLIFAEETLKSISKRF